MKRSLCLVLLAAASLTACSRKDESSPTLDAEAEATQTTPVKGDAKAPAAAPAYLPMLAYRYRYAIRTPGDKVRELMATHEKACAAAGPAICQLVDQKVHEQGKSNVEGSLTLRATPAWLQDFRAGVDDQAKAAGGKVTSDEVSSEDLTRRIIDVDAAIAAKVALRDRLQTLIATRTGKLSELLEVEEELARVQAQIDAAQSSLRVMRQQVAMSELSIDYSSTGVWAPEGAWAPLGSAVHDVVGLTAFTTAALVRTLALLSPWALVIGLGAWLWSRRRAKRVVAKVSPAA